MRKKKKVEFLEDPIGVSIDVFEEEFFTEKKECAEEHPTAEQLMIRQAVNRLTEKQKQVWDMWNFERATQDEIGDKLGISHQAVAKHIKAIEAKIAKYCRQRMEVYKLIKEQEESKALKIHQRKVQNFHENDSKY